MYGSRARFLRKVFLIHEKKEVGGEGGRETLLQCGLKKYESQI